MYTFLVVGAFLLTFVALTVGACLLFDGDLRPRHADIHRPITERERARW